MKYLLALLITFFGFTFSYAGDEPYAVSNINISMLKNANVVKRLELIRFEIESTKEAVLNYRHAFTILNANGDKHAGFYEWYDKLKEIVSIEGTLYDANGKVIKKLKPKDIQDQSAVSDISLMEDNRQKVHNFYHRIYPYTIEYEVKVRHNNTFNFPGWVTQEDELLSVEKSSYTIICPADYTFRYRTVNYKGQPVEKNEKGKKIFTWEVKDLPAIKKEPFAPRWQEITTMLSAAPTDFEIQGYKGNMSSWKEFGKFLYQLTKDRHVLPAEVKQKVHAMTGDLNSKKEKVKTLYNFLQQNTRYISIQLGLGGWQPFEAAYVAKKGYGDCKALSNYMYSLLKEVNIPSYYAVIKAGPFEHFLMDDFPANQFNHAILCVPLEKDTMWLECTSQTDPAGYMGHHTGNRKALLIDENGGTLVNTPRYTLKDNIQLRAIKAKVDEEGGLQITSQTDYSSMQQDRLHQMINGLTNEKMKEALREELDFATYDIRSFNYSEKKGEHPVITEDLDLYVSNYATITGKRLFIAPNLMNRSDTKLTTDEERKFDICLYYEYRDIDSVQIELPEGYTIEAIPQPLALKNKFGTYTSTCKLAGNVLHYVRIREQNAGKFAPSEYGEFVKFFDAIYKADRSKIVLVKK